MRRRAFLGAMAALPFSHGACCPNIGSREGPPNVLMIALDDMNDWVGFLGGHPQAITPALNSLAAQSVVFERAYCNAPWCNPSRASALSGLYAHETGVWNLELLVSETRPDAVALPELFAMHGYDRYLIGKVHHQMSGSIGAGALSTSAPVNNLVCSNSDRLPVSGLFDWSPIPAADEEMADYQIGSDAIRFLKACHRGPFFLGVGFYRNHVPWYVPERYFDLYPAGETIIPEIPADDLADLPSRAVNIALTSGYHECITGQGLWASAVRAYLASLSFVDTQVGRLLAALDASPYADNTVVILWSDHGFHFGQKLHWHKQALWEESTRIPFLIRPAGPPTTGSRVGASVSLVDMYPTLAELCGLTPAHALSGRSLAPLLADPNAAWDHPVLMTSGQADHAIRTNRWRYIRYQNGDQELYDHGVDPYEWTNLALDPAHAATIAELSAHLPG